MALKQTFRNLSFTLAALCPLAVAHASDKPDDLCLSILGDSDDGGSGTGAGAGAGAGGVASRGGTTAGPAAGSRAMGKTPRERMIASICLGDVGLLKQELNAFMKAKGDPAQMVDFCGYTPLHLAASLGYLDMVKCLVASGFSPNQMSRILEPHTPLHSAIMAHPGPDDAQGMDNQVLIVKFMVERGKADLGKRTSGNLTALDLAGKSGNTKLMEFLRGLQAEGKAEKR